MVRIRNFRCLMRRFRRQEEGAAIIEFALVLPMAALLLFAIVELGIIFYVTSTVNTIGHQAARFAKTGYDYSEGKSYAIASGSDAAFAGSSGAEHYSVDAHGNVTMRGREGYIREWLKTKGDALLDPQKLTLNTKVYASMTQAGKGNTARPGSAPYDMGGTGNAVAYEIAYKWDVLCPLLYPFFGTSYTIKTVSIIQNEAF